MLRQVACSLNSRFFSTSQLLNKRSSLQKLSASVRTRLDSTKGSTQVEPATFVNLIQDVLNFRSNNKNVNTDQLLDDILESPNFRIDQESLKEIMLLKPSGSQILKIINLYYSKNPGTHIPRSIAMIPTRSLLWDGDVQSATKVVELTTGSPHFIAYKKQKQVRALMKYFAGLGGLIGAVDVGLRSAGLEPAMGIYAMVATYVLNMSFFATLSFSDKITGQSSLLQYQRGVSQIYRSQHSDELEMLTRVAEVDAKFNGVDGFLSAEFVSQLESKNLEPVEPESEIMMQEYWLSGGDSFEWSEPDQDPAEILWDKRIEELKPNQLKNGTKWTKKLIESNTDQESTSDLEGSVIA